MTKTVSKKILTPTIFRFKERESCFWLGHLNIIKISVLLTVT
jgi:hypothetical protein